MIRVIVAVVLGILACTNLAFAGEQENVEIVKSMIAAVNERDFDALDGLIASDIVRHSSATPGLTVSSLAEFKAFLGADLSVCPDAQQKVELIFGSGEMVAVLAHYSGTQTGAMGSFPASGKTMEIPFMGILRLEDGKIAEMWVEWDNLNALMQLGHFPPGSGDDSGQ